MTLREQDSAVQAAPSGRERALVSVRTGFGRILAALHDAELELAGWAGADALIDEALGVHGSTLACGERLRTSVADTDVRDYVKRR